MGSRAAVVTFQKPILVVLVFAAFYLRFLRRP
jgi:hypothetical protein